MPAAGERLLPTPLFKLLLTESRPVMTTIAWGGDADGVSDEGDGDDAPSASQSRQKPPLSDYSCSSVSWL